MGFAEEKIELRVVTAASLRGGGGARGGSGRGLGLRVRVVRWVVAVRVDRGCASGSRGGYRLRTFSSVRLFFALPSGVLLSAMGWVSPQPLGERRAGVMPLAIR